MTSPDREWIAALWEEVRPSAAQKVDAVAEAVDAIADGRLDLVEARAAGWQEAHRLAGSLGTYGLPDAARAAAELEHLLLGASASDGPTLRALVARLRAAVGSGESSPASAVGGPAGEPADAERLRLEGLLAAATGHSIIATDTAGVITVFNVGAERMLQRSAGDVVGRETPMLFHDAAEVTARAAEMGISPGFGVFVDGTRRTGVPETREWTYIRADGARLPVSLTITAIRDSTGSIEGYAGIASDLTAQRAAVVALAASEERLRELADLADEGIWTIDGGATTTYVNRRMAAMLGYQPDEMLGRHVGEFVDDTPGRAAGGDRRQTVSWADVVAGGHHRTDRRSKDGEPTLFRFRRRDGSALWVTLKAKPLADADGTARGTVAMVTDVTERRSAERARARTEARYRALVQHAADGIAIVSGDGAISYASPAARAILGDSACERCGVAAAIHPDDWPRLREALAGAHAGSTSSASLELRLAREAGAGGGQRWVEVIVNDLRDHPGVGGVVLHVRDVTERRAVLQLKEEIVAVVSHELRTPLTAMKGALGLVAAGVAGEIDDDARELVSVALRNAERLERMVQDVLRFEEVQRETPLHREPVSARDLVRDAVEAVRDPASESGVVIDADDADLFVTADHDRFVQVLVNLLGNATKWSPRGGRVRLSVRLAGDEVEFAVRDEGPGIDADRQVRIFEAFEQGDASDSRVAAGTGLGLAIAKGIVRQHHGRIWVESSPGEGSVFRVRVPAA